MITLDLPFPPALNNLTAVVRGRKITSKRGRQYRTEAVQLIKQQARCNRMKERVAVTIELFPPCRRRRDIDNYSKAILDAITDAGVWADDEQVDYIAVTRRDVEKGGRCVVVIEAIKGA